MDVIVIILFIILIVLVIALRNTLVERFDKLEKEILRLKEEVKKGQSGPQHGPAPMEAPQQSRQAAAVAQATAAPPKPVFETEPFRPATPPPPHKHQESAVRSESGIRKEVPAPASPPHFTRIEEPVEQGFFERHPDLEKFIGENLISKIGIAILVLAIGFFVKYAIDNDWIGPVGRVGVGVLCGGILIGIAHRLRNQYTAFSSVLVGGGLAVLYFTIALAYHQYQLFGQTAAFIIMLVITAFSVLLALLYDRQELAIIALVGGFVTPFLVSNGRGDYVVLFSYLLILNAGLLVIAYNKAWRLLNILAFGFTAILFTSWLISLPYDARAATYRGGWVFATVFYLLFFVINIAYTIRKNKPFVASDFGILLVNTCLYFAAGLYLIAQLGLEQYKGLFCAVMGIFHLGATWFLFRKNTVDKNVLYLLVGITLSFVSLTAPLQLHGHYITLFWASESVLLYWLYLKSNMRLIQVGSLLIWVAMMASLAIDWANTYFAIYDMPGAHPGPDEVLPVIFNKGFMTGLFSALCCGALFYLHRESLRGRSGLVAGAIILFIGGALEMNHQLVNYFPGTELTLLYLTGYTFIFFLTFDWFSGRLKINSFRLAGSGLLAAAVLLYLVSLPGVFDIQHTMLEGGRYKPHFGAHWIGVVVVLFILHRLVKRERAGGMRIDPPVFTWLICGVIVTLLSAEGQLLVNALWYSRSNDLDNLARVYNKTGLPILWGLCSFIFMWLGMRYKFKPLRIVSLTLFSLTLLKLFLFDIRNIPVAGKIAAFFCLGVLLLVVSFMYQRLKKIIIEDEEKKSV